MSGKLALLDHMIEEMDGLLAKESRRMESCPKPQVVQPRSSQPVVGVGPQEKRERSRDLATGKTGSNLC
jgi:hypothetical protein